MSESTSGNYWRPTRQHNAAALVLLTTLTLLVAAVAAAHDPPVTAPAPGGHSGSEGVLLGQTRSEPRSSPLRTCPEGAAVREYAIAALDVEITLNRFLDYDPAGLMFVLESEIDRVREEERLNREARSGGSEPGVSIGLQGDAIQPLVLRVNQGECLRVTLNNRLNDAQPVSFEIHGAALNLAGLEEMKSPAPTPATAVEPAAVSLPGASVTYEWWVDETEPEATHYFHSHTSARSQTSHGLFGAVVVEPKGSVHLDPLSGRPIESGWSAIIAPPEGPNFREFVLFYHEIGNERYRHLDGRGGRVVQIDPYTGAYRPGDRAINYRSEPFMNRMQLQRERQGHFDKSLAYSSYAFGDPATPVARSYLGDPVKQRLVHGGSEVFHVHHVHGGATRWQRQPGMGEAGFAAGLDKQRPLTTASSRLDAQAVGPSESFDLEHECGSGGCQMGAGDYLIHCHIAHHYFAGMWMLWRVYNTLQIPHASLDGLPELRELPDRVGGMKPGVTSVELAGLEVDWQGNRTTITPERLGEWVERQLPARGVPREDDASVFDWERQGDLYLNEPDSEEAWPGHSSDTPGQRRPILFDPTTGKLAYPWLRPHLGNRPPFAPNHGPAPFLDPAAGGDAPAVPGANGGSSLCPVHTELRQYTIHAVSVPVTLNRRLDIVDPVGQLYVLKEDEERMRSDDEARVPLAIRANASEDCVDVLFKSELPDARENAFHSKANIHIHFVQFDVQASDGVTAGYNFEQSVRPFTVEGEQLTLASDEGDSLLHLTGAERFQPGALVGVGMDQEETFEVRRVVSVSGNEMELDRPLRHPHGTGEIVSSEFVRYRWFPDVQFGTAYFHDHVAALTSWQHGLFGALVAEPPGSSYRHPYSGESIRSGPLADIHTDEPVSADVDGSFRELVLFVQDDNPLTKQPDTTGSSFNLRAEPRGGEPATMFNSRIHGDPETPVVEAYLGDPLVIRGLVPSTNDIHSLTVSGHWFRLEPHNLASRPVNTVSIGISERADLVLPAAGGPQAMPGDYLFRNGRISKLREGSWGLLRVLEGEEDEPLLRLPGRERRPAASTVCPEGSPEKRFEVVAIEVPLPMLAEETGRIFVAAADRAAIQSGEKPAEPWVVRANVGDCLRIQLSNGLPSGSVSLHAAMLAADPRHSSGIEAGFNPDQSVEPGASREYLFYAHPEVGETAALVTDGVSPLDNPRLGLYGAIIIGAPGTRYTDSRDGSDTTLESGWEATAHPAAGRGYRDFVLFLQDEDTIIGTAIMPYVEQVSGVNGLNYRTTPLPAVSASEHGVLTRFHEEDLGEPSTPVLEAYEGDPIRIHVLAPSSEQMHVFSLEAHRWRIDAGADGSNLVSSQALGALQSLTLELEGGAGPPGRYLYGDHREPYRDVGLWGFLLVHPEDGSSSPLQPLPAPRSP